MDIFLVEREKKGESARRGIHICLLPAKPEFPWRKGESVCNLYFPAVTTHRDALEPKRLSGAERRVLAFSACGYTKEETARYLTVGVETIKSQRQAILTKLGARNMPHAVALGFLQGDLSPDRLRRVKNAVEMYERLAEIKLRAREERLALAERS